MATIFNLCPKLVRPEAKGLLGILDKRPIRSPSFEGGEVSRQQRDSPTTLDENTNGRMERRHNEPQEIVQFNRPVI